MNYYTAIWEDRWRSGSHHHCLTKKTIFKAESPHQIMNSSYGDDIVYLFEGIVLTLGETFKEEDVKVLVNKSYSPFDDSIEYHESFA